MLNNMFQQQGSGPKRGRRRIPDSPLRESRRTPAEQKASDARIDEIRERNAREYEEELARELALEKEQEENKQQRKPRKRTRKTRERKEKKTTAKRGRKRKAATVGGPPTNNAFNNWRNKRQGPQWRPLGRTIVYDDSDEDLLSQQEALRLSNQSPPRLSLSADESFRRGVERLDDVLQSLSPELRPSSMDLNEVLSLSLSPLGDRDLPGLNEIDLGAVLSLSLSPLGDRDFPNLSPPVAMGGNLAIVQQNILNLDDEDENADFDFDFDFDLDQKAPSSPIPADPIPQYLDNVNALLFDTPEVKESYERMLDFRQELKARATRERELIARDGRQYRAAEAKFADTFQFYAAGRPRDPTRIMNEVLNAGLRSYNLETDADGRLIQRVPNLFGNDILRTTNTIAYPNVYEAWQNQPDRYGMRGRLSLMGDSGYNAFQRAFIAEEKQRFQEIQAFAQLTRPSREGVEEAFYEAKNALDLQVFKNASCFENGEVVTTTDPNNVDLRLTPIYVYKALEQVNVAHDSMQLALCSDRSKFQGRDYYKQFVYPSELGSSTRLENILAKYVRTVSLKMWENRDESPPIVNPENIVMSLIPGLRGRIYYYRSFVKDGRTFDTFQYIARIAKIENAEDDELFIIGAEHETKADRKEIEQAFQQVNSFGPDNPGYEAVEPDEYADGEELNRWYETINSQCIVYGKYQVGDPRYAYRTWKMANAKPDEFPNNILRQCAQFRDDYRGNEPVPILPDDASNYLVRFTPIDPNREVVFKVLTEKLLDWLIQVPGGFRYPSPDNDPEYTNKRLAKALTEYDDLMEDFEKKWLRIELSYQGVPRDLVKNRFYVGTSGDGRFFPYLNKAHEFLDLTSLQIYGHKTDEYANTEEHCFIESLRKSGHVAEPVLESIKLMFMLSNRRLPVRVIQREIGPRFFPELELTILRYNGKYDSKTYAQTVMNRHAKPINAGAPNKFTMVCMEEHFFPNLTFPVSRWFILNYDRVSQLIRDKKIAPPTKASGAKITQIVRLKKAANGGVRAGYDKNSTLTAFHLVRLMLENNQEERFFTKEGVRKVTTQSELRKNALPPLTEPLFSQQTEYNIKQKPELEQLVIAADLEACLNQKTNDSGISYESHTPLMMAWVPVEMAEKKSLYEDGKALLRSTRLVDGESCVKKAFDQIVEYYRRCFPEQGKLSKKKKPLLFVYFHNLKYDAALIMPIMQVIGACLKNNIMYGVDLLVQGVIVHLRDSFKTLNFALSQFKSSLNLPNGFGKVSGTLTNYHFFNDQYLRKRNESGETQVKMYEYLQTDSDVKVDVEPLCEELRNVPELAGTFSIPNKTFDALAFYGYYCKQDVVTLAGGIQKFDYIIQHELQRDTTTTKVSFLSGMTLPSLTKRLLYSLGVFEGAYGLSHLLRRFALEASYGGRCCVNPKFQCKIIKDGDPIAPQGLSYDDACSLYPSATWFISEKLGGFPVGKASLLAPEEKNLAFLKTVHTYVVRIQIKKIRKSMACGIGIVSHRVGNSIKYRNTMLPDEVIDIIVNNVTLEDYIEFHDIEFEIVEGFYFCGEGNRRFGHELAKLYQERRRYESDGNKAVGQVIKLMLNASYGSCKPKPSATKFTYSSFLPGSDGLRKMQNQRLRKWPLLVGYSEIGQNVETEWLHVDQDATLEVWAGLILAVSKRLMNRVFFACSVANIPVMYTDTDSLKYPYHSRELLEKTFNDLYAVDMGRPLVGKELGQFHSDFDLRKPDGKSIASDLVRSIFSIVCGRKLYLHILTSVENPDVFGYKLSCKGFPKAAVLYYARRFYEKPRKRAKYDHELPNTVQDIQLRGLAMMFTALSQGRKLIINMYPRELGKSKFQYTGRGNVSTSREAVYRTMVMTGDVDPEIARGKVSEDGMAQDPSYLQNVGVAESDTEYEEEQVVREEKNAEACEKQLQKLESFHDVFFTNVFKKKPTTPLDDEEEEDRLRYTNDMLCAEQEYNKTLFL